MKLERIAVLMSKIIIALALVTGQSRADYVPLPSDLHTMVTAGNYTTVNNTNITFSGYSSSTNGGVALPSGAISVDAITGGSMGFELTGPMAAEGISQNDIAVTYSVVSSGAGFGAISLTTNGATTGGGFVQVVEDIYADSEKLDFLGQISVNGAGTAIAFLSGSYTTLYVTKNITYDTYNAGDTATFSIIDQNFFTPGAIPEPASVAMMGVGLGLVGFYGSARARRKAIIV